METLSAVVEWTYRAVATWYAAAIIGGMLIFLAERLSRWREPSDVDVKRAVARYRQHYGERALDAISDHLLAASFAPDSRHRRFLKRVFSELLATSGSDEDRARAIEP